MRTAVLIIGNIKRRQTSAMRRVFERANVCVNRGDNVLLLNFLPNDDFCSLVEYHRLQGNIHEDVKVLNMFQSNLTPSEQREPQYVTTYEQRVQDGLSRRANKTSQFGYHCFQGEAYVMYEQYDQAMNLDFIDYFGSDKKRIKREIYRKGSLIRTMYVGSPRYRPRLHVHYHHDGTPSITVAKPKFFGTKSYFFHDLVFETDNIYELAAYWVHYIMAELKKPMLLDEKNGKAGKLMQSLTRPELRKPSKRQQVISYAGVGKRKTKELIKTVVRVPVIKKTVLYVLRLVRI